MSGLDFKNFVAHFGKMPSTCPNNSGKTLTHSPVKPQKIKVDKTEAVGKTTTRNEITNNGVTLIYIKVEYTWGGKFFFIEDEPRVYRNISEQYYIKILSNK